MDNSKPILYIVVNRANATQYVRLCTFYIVDNFVDKCHFYVDNYVFNVDNSEQQKLEILQLFMEGIAS